MELILAAFWWIKLILILIVGAYLVSAIVAILYNRKLKKDGHDGIPYIDCFKVSKLASVFLGFVIGQIPEHIIEQYVFRMYHEECRQCYLTENCKHSSCGCNSKYVICSPLERCMKHGKPMMMANFGKIIFNKERYEQLRVASPIKISAEYVKKFDGFGGEDRADSNAETTGG